MKRYGEFARVRNDKYTYILSAYKKFNDNTHIKSQVYIPYLSFEISTKSFKKHNKPSGIRLIDKYELKNDGISIFPIVRKFKEYLLETKPEYVCFWAFNYYSHRNAQSRRRLIYNKFLNKWNYYHHSTVDDIDYYKLKN